jgi:hypothetical protein
MFDDLDVPSQLGLDPPAFAFILVSAVSPDQLQTRKAAFERRKHELAAALILDVSLMHQHAQDQPSGVEQQMALPAFDLVSAIIATHPPFCVVLTD